MFSYLIITSGFVYHGVVIMKPLAVDHNAMGGICSGESYCNLYLVSTFVS
jgi:hypothetical protein